ncbi:uncharacterized protein LOC125757360 [Rhipicephalus sanguineus]|uniref:uncharacterized protein LOC125757360 n=1 Tax=Rhipicephalus sanguineus TaxID=34632 RepID=UPI0020C34119|nr:uncharacterized protein LOC125757360 [Rhipicephalus sanguineus]
MNTPAKAAARRARRQDPAVRAREAEAKRARRQADPEVRASEARRQADPAVRCRRVEAARARRQDPAVRAREAEAHRARRQANPEVRARDARRRADPAVRGRKAEADRKRRQENPQVRARDAAAKRQKRLLPEVGGADARFKRDFLDHTFGHSCKVCDRLWFDNNMTIIASIRNEQSRANAVAVFEREFPVAATPSAPPTDFSTYRVCSTCKSALVAGKVPTMSVTHGYRYPPRPSHLPALNPVEERLIAPRLPFMSARRLTHGSGQYGIKGQVVNVPIDVAKTVQCLPRNVPDDAAFDVHIKRRLVNKPCYRKGLPPSRAPSAFTRPQTPARSSPDFVQCPTRA